MRSDRNSAFAADFETVFHPKFSASWRVGDLRRLIRQYARPANTVFPTGTWHNGGAYGGDAKFPVPQAEENNPNVPAGQGCIDRNA